MKVEVYFKDTNKYVTFDHIDWVKIIHADTDEINTDEPDEHNQYLVLVDEQSGTSTFRLSHVVYDILPDLTKKEKVKEIQSSMRTDAIDESFSDEKVDFYYMCSRHGLTLSEAYGYDHLNKLFGYNIGEGKALSIMNMCEDVDVFEASTAIELCLMLAQKRE